MNQVATTQGRVPTETVGIANGNGSKIAPQNLAEVIRFSEVMCQADIALPKHLRGNQGACMAVALQALEWEMSPFAVASKSYSVNGMIAYEAQLIAAVVNTRSGIKGRLKYHYTGSGDDMVCTVTGEIDGDPLEYESPRLKSITPKNSPLWKTDPRQQLGYYSARSWARRHCPEVLLGVYDRDEAAAFQGPENARDVTPERKPLSERLTASKPAGADQPSEGFSTDHIDRETGEIRDGEYETVGEGDEGSPEPAPADAPGEDGPPSDTSPGDEIGPEKGNASTVGDLLTDPRTEEGRTLFGLLNAESVEALTADERHVICHLCDELAEIGLKSHVQECMDRNGPALNGLSQVGKRLARGAQQARIAQIEGKV
jgi:hypothetical protein